MLKKNKVFVDYVSRFEHLKVAAKKLGISLSSASFYSRGIQVPSPRTMVKIADKSKQEVPVSSWFQGGTQ